jgi:DNA-binding NarL/FixJ family response regulator
VVIGEDDVLMRAGLARLLADEGLSVVAEAGDAQDLLRKVIAHKPDVAICDVQMPPGRQEDGLEAAIEIRRVLPWMAVLVLSQYHEPSYALRLIGDRPDGVGYLLKERVGRVASFVDAVERVAAGGSALDPVVVARMLKRQQRGDPLGRLTGREHDVLAAMAEGKSNIGIAKALHVTEAAVEKHVTSIFRKLELGAETTEHRRVQAVLTYVRGRANARPLVP